MNNSVSSASLQRWRSGLPTPRERLHRLLLETITPAHLRRVLALESMPQSTASPSWFMWRVLSLTAVPEACERLAQELPAHAEALEAIGSSWAVFSHPGQQVLLEFREPDGASSVRSIEQLLRTLQQELDAELPLIGVLYGRHHLRPEASLTLVLSVDADAAGRLTEDEDLLAGIGLSSCRLHAVHTTHERVWVRPAPQPQRMSTRGIYGVAATGTLLCIGVLVVVLPNFLSMGKRAKRAEVPANVDGIKTAELAYEAAFDNFVPVPEFHPSANVGKASRTWAPGSSFDTLGWAPDGKVRGAYKVDVFSSDFQVTGIIDSDADGELATYTAMKSTTTAQITDNDIH